MKQLITALLMLLAAGCIGGEQKPPEAKTANYGDSVVVDYTLWVDGKVVDTSIASMAQGAGIYKPQVPYQPLGFQVLHGKGLIRGFVDGVVGMKEGETRNITVSPASGYGMPDVKSMYNYSMRYNKSIYETAPLSALRGKELNLTVGTVLQAKQGLVVIWDVTNDTVTLKYLFAEGSTFTMYGLPQVVESVSNETAYIRFDVRENETYSVVEPDTGATGIARARFVTNESFILDKNHPYAGKTLVFELSMRAITKQGKE